MNKNNHSLAVLLAGAVAVVGSQPADASPVRAAASAAKPNLLVILANDLGWEDVGYPELTKEDRDQ